MLRLVGVGELRCAHVQVVDDLVPEASIGWRVSPRETAFTMFDCVDDRFIDAANLFIDLLNCDAFRIGSPHGLVCHIDHKPAQGRGLTPPAYVRKSICAESQRPACSCLSSANFRMTTSCVRRLGIYSNWALRRRISPFQPKTLGCRTWSSFKGSVAGPQSHPIADLGLISASTPVGAGAPTMRLLAKWVRVYFRDTAYGFFSVKRLVPPQRWPETQATATAGLFG